MLNPEKNKENKEKTQEKNQEKNQEKSKKKEAEILGNKVKEAEVNPFQPSAKISRSPQTRIGKVLETPIQLFPKSITTPKNQTVNCDDETPRSTNNGRLNWVTTVNQTTTETGINTPLQELIRKSREAEEETVIKCRNALKKIRQAIGKQRNISMDVQNGVSELEELLDVLGEHRGKWKSAEAEREKGRTQTETAVKTPKVCDTATTLPRKRTATSPAEKLIPEKRKKPISQGKKPTSQGKKPTSQGKKPTSQGKKPSREDERHPRENGNKMEINPPNRNPLEKTKPRKKIPKARSNAVVVKPAQGRSYADILKQLKDKVRPEDAEVTVRSIRKTKAGAILLELDRGGNVQQFSETIRDSLKGGAEVKNLEPRTTIEIRDIDCTSTQQDITSAICEKTGASQADITTRLTRLNTWDQRRAFVELPTKTAIAILKTERIKVGWTNCRVRHIEELKRCFRCFGVGHGQWECKGPDRKSKGICIRCGKEGHILKQCQNPPDCCLCTEQGISPTNHLPGSRGCKANRQK